MSLSKHTAQYRAPAVDAFEVISREAAAEMLREARSIKYVPGTHIGRCTYTLTLMRSAGTRTYILNIYDSMGRLAPVATIVCTSPRPERKPIVVRPKTVPQELCFGYTEAQTRQSTAYELRIWRRNCAMSKGQCRIHCNRDTDRNFYEFMDTQHVFAYQPNPISVPRLEQRVAKPQRLPHMSKAFEADYCGGMAVSNVQELAVGQRRRMAEGISYGYRLEPGITDAQVLALLQIKDMMRRVNMGISVDGLGRIVFIKRAVADQSELAFCTFV